MAQRLDEQLDAAVRGFLANEEKGLRVRREEGLLWGHNNNVYLSKIFDWFEEDFERGGQTVIDFVRPYLSDKDRGFLDKYADDLNTKYMGYDWTLNGR